MMATYKLMDIYRNIWSNKNAVHIETDIGNIKIKQEKLLQILYWEIQDYCNENKIDLTRD